MHITRFLTVAGAALTQPVFAGVTSYQVGGPVSTTSGTVTGQPGRGAPEVSAYLGIPFAYPPVGARRWLAPERFKGDAPINATKFGRDCPGTLSLGASTGLGGKAVDPTEDCLYLSVWAPQRKTGDRPKAVLIWIYGGAFVGGGTSLSMSDGAKLAQNEDVIVVAGNYRLSIFGFPGGPGLPDQNLGLLDQRAAVEWVRDNIAGFGGDPNKIVLFGESAGADSVDLYSHAWTKDPIVKGFIAESGASTMCGLVGNQSYANWQKVSTSLGCTEAAKNLECMRGKSIQDVQKAAKGLPSGFPPTFVPIPDGKVAFDDYYERGERGLFIKAPFIIGNNDRELGADNLQSEREFICPAAQVVNSRRAHGVPAWRYRFYGGGPPLPGVKQSTSNPAAHGAEITYVFGSFGSGTSSLASVTPQKLAVSSEFQKVWAEFARDPENGPKKLGWPVYDAKGDTLVRLMYQNETKASFIRGDAYDANCPKKLVCRSTVSGAKGAKGAKGGGASLVGRLEGLRI